MMSKTEIVALRTTLKHSCWEVLIREQLKTFCSQSRSKDTCTKNELKFGDDKKLSGRPLQRQTVDGETRLHCRH